MIFPKEMLVFFPVAMTFYSIVINFIYCPAHLAPFVGNYSLFCLFAILCCCTCTLVSSVVTLFSSDDCH